jgi:hypothetical protein
MTNVIIEKAQLNDIPEILRVREITRLRTYGIPNKSLENDFIIDPSLSNKYEYYLETEGYYIYIAKTKHTIVGYLFARKLMMKLKLNHSLF